MELNNQPISNIKWIDGSKLVANDYNPNVVLTQEMNLLKLSILSIGWIQPVLINENHIIIDGFHRWWLSQNDKEVKALTGGQVPVVELDIDDPHAKLLTIRINRAKGQHVAIKMHEVITSVFESGIPKEEIAKEMGAHMEEVDLLLQENVFKKLDTANKKYSKAWIPKT